MEQYFDFSTGCIKDIYIKDLLNIVRGSEEDIHKFKLSVTLILVDKLVKRIESDGVSILSESLNPNSLEDYVIALRTALSHNGRLINVVTEFFETDIYSEVEKLKLEIVNRVG